MNQPYVALLTGLPSMASWKSRRESPIVPAAVLVWESADLVNRGQG